MSDGIVLIGLPGSGKSLVGRKVAEMLGRPFVDLDADVERVTGRSPAEHINRDGVEVLRAFDRDAVRRASTIHGAVIATGGGSPLEPLNRWAFVEHGVTVRLDVPLDVLAGRLGKDTVERPLLGADVAAGLETTAADRSAVYRAVDTVVDADAAPGIVARRVAAAVDAVNARGATRWRPLFDATVRRQHSFGPGEGRLLTGRGLDAQTLSEAVGRAASGKPVFMVDRAARDCHPSLAAIGTGDRALVLEGGEHSKTFDGLRVVLEWLADQAVERGDPLVVLGGGTLGDLGGLAASLHRRGIPLVNVPTTWLAQSDSAIGGKVAIDLDTAKNGVGAFWPASLIVADADLPATLPVERRRDGIAECIKCGLIGDSQLWELAERRGAAALNGEDPAAAYALTERAARLKLAIVERDPFETGERRKLNLGHTIGHALEIESGYELAHGEAVALGLRAVAQIAAGRGADAHLADRIDSLLVELGFGLTRTFDRAAVISAIGGDKKREGGVQRWILPMAVGEVIEVADVTQIELDAALDAISR
jgi:shikimate kinase/3-dehydroquinate synthase